MTEHSNSMQKPFNKKIIYIAALIFVLLIAWLFTGYVRSYLDEGQQTTFFIKKFPTFQLEFVDPFANEGDSPAIAELSTVDRKSLVDYCKYRFGVTSDSDDALDTCAQNIPGYLKQ
ncbi:hypothetical protein [Collimonas pratensis]|uniref:hypothetical protein n=1 Tax=Collimonas pratensis TaxID=279113 RepID=UPI001F10BE31|nr:hypothetical protein [Collimonas pratensis]